MSSIKLVLDVFLVMVSRPPTANKMPLPVPPRLSASRLTVLPLVPSEMPHPNPLPPILLGTPPMLAVKVTS